MDEQTNPPVSTPTPPASAPKHEENLGWAIVAYIIFFLPLLTKAKDDPFVRFHVKQGLVLFLLMLVFWLIKIIMPWYLYWRLSELFGLFTVIFLILGLLNVLQGKQEKLPLIGQFADKFKF